MTVPLSSRPRRPARPAICVYSPPGKHTLNQGYFAIVLWKGFHGIPKHSLDKLLLFLSIEIQLRAAQGDVRPAQLAQSDDMSHTWTMCDARASHSFLLKAKTMAGS
eukprot:scaffold311_cov405-Prasinococcus_capsulatus_cf.AAC.6